MVDTFYCFNRYEKTYKIYVMIYLVIVIWI